MQHKKSLLLDQLSFQFAAHKPFIFENITVSFPVGLNIIRGNNGTGKSTLTRILSGVSQDEETISGHIHIGGNTYSLPLTSNEKASYQQQVRLVCQQVDRMIADQLTGKQNLALAHLSTYPSFRRLADHYSLLESFQTAGINLEKQAHALSGGQRQLLALSMTISQETSVLLLDEPTAALDKHNAHLVMKTLKTLAQERNLIIIAIVHDQELANQFAPDNQYHLTADPSTGLRHLYKIEDS